MWLEIVKLILHQSANSAMEEQSFREEKQTKVGCPIIALVHCVT